MSIQRWWRLAFQLRQREALVWSDLKAYLQQMEWRVGTFEKERYVEVPFQLVEGYTVPFYYGIGPQELYLQVHVMEAIPPDVITDAFILSAHFNNVLNSGKVLVDAERGAVLHRWKVELLLPFLFPREIEVFIASHFNTAKDIHGAFRRLVEEREAPAIIIADLLRQIEANPRTD